MSEQYPLFPQLPDEAAKEAQELIDAFKKAIAKEAERVISEMYTDIVMWIESDSWTNFRSALLSGLANYGNCKIQGEYDFKKIRQAIYKEYYNEIVQDLNQDLLEENEKLKKDKERLREQLEMIWRAKHDNR